MHKKNPNLSQITHFFPNQSGTGNIRKVEGINAVNIPIKYSSTILIITGSTISQYLQFLRLLAKATHAHATFLKSVILNCIASANKFYFVNNNRVNEMLIHLGCLATGKLLEI
jgi:hypothetical protein